MVIVTSLDIKRTVQQDSFPNHTGTSSLRNKNETNYNFYWAVIKNFTDYPTF